MRGWRRPLPIAATAVAIPLLAAAALAASGAVTFAGTTQQGYGALVRVGSAGFVRLAAVRWKAPCERDRSTFTDRTRFVPPYRVSTRRRFVARGRYKVRDPGGFLSRVRIAIRGRHPVPRRWKGTFHVGVEVTRNGADWDHCRLQRVHWVAARTG